MTGIAIGCAGWSIPRQHQALFGAGDSVLARYATVFSAVEINSSFYRSHQASTYARWAASVPARFRFSVKLPKAISHEAALRGCGPLLDRFLGEVAGLGRKLDRLLLQLPPSHPLQPRVASAFFRALRHRTGVAVVCEARHPSWFTAAAQALLDRYAIGRVSADPPVAGGDTLPPDPRWPYWRLHGSPRIYYSDYPEDFLAAFAASVPRTRATWVVFDNTAHGFAVANAHRLQVLLAQARGRRRGTV